MMEEMYDLPKNVVKKYVTPTILFSTIEIDGYGSWIAHIFVSCFIFLMKPV